MPTIRQQLQRIKNNDKRRKALRAEINRQVQILENSYKPRFFQLDKDDGAARKVLATLAPVKVGDRIQRIVADGLPGGNVYQVTHVTDHQVFHARLVTAKGKLGSTVERFDLNKRYRPDVIKKVK